MKYFLFKKALEYFFQLNNYIYLYTLSVNNFESLKTIYFIFCILLRNQKKKEKLYL